jgi:hypothetical protein
MRQLVVLILCSTIVGLSMTACQSNCLKRTNAMEKEQAEQSEIKSIHFRSVSKKWSAYCNYYSDGRVEGSHLSGNPPFVHQEKNTVSKAVVDDLWQKAAQVCRELFPENPVPNPEWKVYEQIDIICQKGTVQVLWQKSPEKEELGSEVQKLLAVILEHRIGGW